ncbi:UbiA family prenyltransferase [Pollutibacter soli]|uniref:UbiA family prenyltransferase n=1 Tax=Pollutibacter soli TaxID=3034157 RepID=UPI00301359B9
MILRYSTIQLLRFPFSFFLMPVYFFALSQVPHIRWSHALIIFVILHLLVYPSSNGYNSYMDRDEGPIGGLKNPEQPTKQLLYASIAMDLLAVALGFQVHSLFALGTGIYILMSRAYSYRGIRLKKYPVIGYLTVVIFQGAMVFALVWFGASAEKSMAIPWLPAMAASALIGGFYPLTQVYQHEADDKDGVRTISMLLGLKGTFLFSGLIYTIAFACLFIYFRSEHRLAQFYVLTTLLLPVLVYFIGWARKVWIDKSASDFRHSMKMNVIASLCTTTAFIILLIWNNIE